MLIAYGAQEGAAWILQALISVAGFALIGFVLYHVIRAVPEFLSDLWDTFAEVWYWFCGVGVLVALILTAIGVAPIASLLIGLAVALVWAIAATLS